MASKTKKKPPGKTATSTKGNTNGPTAQQQGKIVKGAGAGSSSASKKKKKAKKKSKGDPVSVATGAVVELVTDLEVEGVLPFEWARSYSSDNAAQTGPLGRGWTHSFHQWLEIDGDSAFFHDDEGDVFELPLPEVGGSSLNRTTQLELHRKSDDTFEIVAIDERIVRELSPVNPGGPAMLRCIRDAWGNRVELSYEDGALVEVTDPAGRSIRVLGDAKRRGRIGRLELWADGALREWFDYEYSEEGDLASATNALGYPLLYQYDGKHRIVDKTLKNGFRAQYEYDEDHGRCVKTWGTGGYHTVEFTYDLDKKTTTTHAEPQPRVFHWDDRGAILRESTFDGQLVEELTYDDDLLVVAESNAAGETKEYEFDARGFLTRYTDPAGNVTEFEIEGDLVVRTILPNGTEKRYLHDARGDVETIVYPDGETNHIARDGRGLVTGVYGPNGTIEESAFDERYDLVRSTDARGSVTTYTYDALGRALLRTDPLGGTTRVEYDVLGQVTSVTYPDGMRVEYGYEPNGEVALIRRPTGDVTTEYTGSGVLSKATFEDGQSWTFTYDREEKPRAVINPKGERYEYRYDAAGRVIEERAFDGQVFKYQYTPSNALGRIEYADETWRAFENDPLGNVLVETSSHGTITFERDELGDIHRATLDEGAARTEVILENDRYGRVLSEMQDGWSIRYEYDAMGRRTSRLVGAPPGNDGGDVATRYHYDVDDDLAGVEHRGHRVLIQRDAYGRDARAYVYGSGVDILSRYDEMDRLIERVATRPSPEGAPGAFDVLSRRAWSHDGAGRPIEMQDRRFGTAHFGYDPLARLVEARQGRRLEIFEYDPAGSIVSRVTETDTSAARWAVGEGNRIRRTDDAEYEHDVCGRRIRRTQLLGGELTDEVTEYTWDCRGRLRELRKPNGERVRYFYDAFGRRLRKELWPAPSAPGTVPPEPPQPRVVRFLWDSDVLAAEHDSERGLRIFVHDLSDEFVPLLHDEQGEVFTYIVDHLGTPKELLDAHGRVAWAAAHSAFGAVEEVWRDPDTKRPLPIASPFRLPGQYADEESGLAYNYYRYFDPDTARFISPDPLGLDGGQNLFAWDGAPTMVVDPFGLFEPDDPGHYVYVLKRDGPGQRPFYVGITNDPNERTGGHKGTGRLAQKGEKMKVIGGPMKYAKARGAEQFNIEKYKTLTGKKGSGKGNRQNSFDKNRAKNPKDIRGQRFKAEYDKLKKAAAAKAAKAKKAKKAKGTK